VSQVLNGTVLADIWQGKIAMWDDAALIELNPAMDLPHANITTVFGTNSSFDETSVHRHRLRTPFPLSTSSLSAYHASRVARHACYVWPVVLRVSCVVCDARCVVRFCVDRRLLGRWGRSATILPRPSRTWSRCRPCWRAAPSDSSAHGSASTTSPYVATPATHDVAHAPPHTRNTQERIEIINTSLWLLAQITPYALTYARVGLLANTSLPAAMMWNRGGRLLTATTAGVQSGIPSRMRLVSCRCVARARV
jgi:hypothetical protein